MKRVERWEGKTSRIPENYIVSRQNSGVRTKGSWQYSRSAGRKVTFLRREVPSAGPAARSAALRSGGVRRAAAAPRPHGHHARRLWTRRAAAGAGPRRLGSAPAAALREGRARRALRRGEAVRGRGSTRGRARARTSPSGPTVTARRGPSSLPPERVGEQPPRRRETSPVARGTAADEDGHGSRDPKQPAGTGLNRRPPPSLPASLPARVSPAPPPPSPFSSGPGWVSAPTLALPAPGSSCSWFGGGGACLHLSGLSSAAAEGWVGRSRARTALRGRREERDGEDGATSTPHRDPALAAASARRLFLIIVRLGRRRAAALPRQRAPPPGGGGRRAAARSRPPAAPQPLRGGGGKGGSASAASPRGRGTLSSVPKHPRKGANGCR
ncbi:translation initiation factor IF-2-like [Tyto alba]|uniref:translation initiation factor IF-2-like n=1 Tax=Tyto alba TaxID=56313 RepID=UPI001C671E8F|nr:translation initiation factor IF-2-like [Tyto alba]